MSQKRSKYEIVSEILKLSNRFEGVNITKIVYSANLNFKNAQQIVLELIENGLLESIETNGRRRYRTTKKGLDFINKYEALEFIQHF